MCIRDRSSVEEVGKRIIAALRGEFVHLG